MDNITVVIATSPIKSHPDTYHIDKVIESVRHHHPESEIIITFDYPHENYMKYQEQYDEYKTEMLWRCLHEYHNVLPLIMDKHEHQSGMMRKALEEVKTPLILYMEHDTPLVTDREIDWGACAGIIESGEAYTVRFHFEEVIPKEHESLILGGDYFLATYQWSQRPHLSSKTYYEYMMERFPEGASFIEDVWHGEVANDYLTDGWHGWYKHRLFIYGIEDDLGFKRSYTTDGREDEVKVGEGI